MINSSGQVDFDGKKRCRRKNSLIAGNSITGGQSAAKLMLYKAEKVQRSVERRRAKWLETGVKHRDDGLKI